MHYLLLIILLMTQVTHAKTEDIYPFQSDQKRKIFNHLSREIRCMVCQNQSLADSNADLALIMRHKIYDMVLEGQSGSEIKSFLQHRYGDFILLTPPVNRHTTVLWLLPFVILLLGSLILFRQLNSRKDS